MDKHCIASLNRISGRPLLIREALRGRCQNSGNEVQATKIAKRALKWYSHCATVSLRFVNDSLATPTLPYTNGSLKLLVIRRSTHVIVLG